jgi:hypothetical protein
VHNSELVEDGRHNAVHVFKHIVDREDHGLPATLVQSFRILGRVTANAFDSILPEQNSGGQERSSLVQLKTCHR